jgi:hypothetical protein
MEASAEKSEWEPLGDGELERVTIELDLGDFPDDRSGD